LKLLFLLPPVEDNTYAGLANKKQLAARAKIFGHSWLKNRDAAATRGVPK
jgi:hypothetical protein